MADNNPHKLSAPSLVLFSTNMTAAMGAGATPPYGISAAQKTALQTATTELAAANMILETAEAAYRVAVKDRDAKRRTCVNAVASVSRTIFASTATAPQIASFGLTPHASSRTKTPPQAPAALGATILPTGEIELRWARGANPQGTTFVVESQSGDGVWTNFGVTTKARLVVSGITPGAATNFRVRAAKDDALSAASPIAPVYSEASAAPFLRLAA